MTRRKITIGVALGLVFLALTLAATQTRAATSAVLNWPEEHELYRWLDRELAPYLAETLSRHPRFKDEPVTFVSITGEQISEDMDSLTRDLIRRLRATLQKSPGVNLAWQGDDAVPGTCRRERESAYRITIEVVTLGKQRHRIAVRALDVHEQRWVSGFGMEWQGALDRTQRVAAATHGRAAPDLGVRARPYTEAQADLLAQRLGQALHQATCGFVGEPLVVFAQSEPDAPAVVNKALGLVANHLASAREVQVVDDPAQANVILSAQAVPIDNGLHQVWMRIRPLERNESLPEFDAQAYLHLSTPGRAQLADRPRPAAVELVAAPGIVSVSVLTPRDPRSCRAADPWRFGGAIASAYNVVPADGCFALELRLQDDAIVFLLTVDDDAGLVRLLPSRCRTFGRIHTTVKRGDALRFPDRDRGMRHALLAPGAEGSETFYAIAATDQRAADRIDQQVATLRDACSNDRPMTPAQIDEQLDALHATVDELGEYAQSQAVRVRYRPRHAQVAQRD